LPADCVHYSPWYAWALLGEVITRTVKTSFGRFVRKEVLEPLAMSDCSVQQSVEDTLPGSELIPRYRVIGSGREVELVGARLVLGEGTAAMGGSGPILGLGRFYRALLGTRRGRRGPLQRRTVEQFTAPHRVGMYDDYYGSTVDWGLGFVAEGALFSPSCSASTFGHDGWGCTFALADVDNGLAIAVGSNGRASRSSDKARRTALISAIYEDLGVR
jgi:CubicO group peptidase (beta-lactamase class C family)